MKVKADPLTYNDILDLYPHKVVLKNCREAEAWVLNNIDLWEDGEGQLHQIIDLNNHDEIEFIKE